MLNAQNYAAALEPRIENPARSPEGPEWSGEGRKALPAAPPPILLRLDGLRATPEALERVRQRVAEMNRQLERAGVPFRLRIA